MSVLTIENSLKSTNADMGSNHLQAHHDDKGYHLDGEPRIIELTDTNINDDSLDLALLSAQKQGVKTESEWEQYNAGLRKNRRKKNYQEYIESLAGQTIKGKQRALANEKMPESKKTGIYQELSAIKRNRGLAIDGSLFYLGNVEDYEDKTDEELRKYRQWEVDAFTDFFNSKEFQLMNPNCFRAEIHLDEKGRAHLQTQSTFYRKAKNGRVSYAKRKILEENLVKYFGSKDKVQRALETLCIAHHTSIAQKMNVSVTLATNDFEKILFRDFSNEYQPSEAEMRTRLPELARVVMFHGLFACAIREKKKSKVNWKFNWRLTTDGRHRTATQYEQEVNSCLMVKRNKKHAAEEQEKVQQAKDELAKTNQRKADEQAKIDEELKTYRANQKAQIDKKLREKDEKLDKRAAELDERENNLKAEKQNLDNTMAMFPSVSEYYRKGEFTIISPDTKNYANMMKNDIVANAKKAGEYDNLEKNYQKVVKALRVLYKRLTHRVVNNINKIVNDVLRPVRKPERPRTPVKHEKQPTQSQPQQAKPKLSKEEQTLSSDIFKDIMNKDNVLTGAKKQKPKDEEDDIDFGD